MRELVIIIVGFANLATIAFLYILIKKIIKLVSELHECVSGLNEITKNMIKILR